MPRPSIASATAPRPVRPVIAETVADNPTMDLPTVDPLAEAPGPTRMTAAQTHGPTATPPPLARQIATALPAPGAQPVELRLNPEELGRVRLSLHQTDNSISVSIVAERAETLDLMRRHIAMLEQEFREIGYTDIAFSFGAPGQGQGGDPGTADRDDPHPPLSPDPALHAVATTAPPPPPTAADGLDIRL